MSSQTGVSPATRVSSISRSSATAFGVLAAIGFCHFLNDLRQSVIPAVYPILKEAYRLDFRQIGLITLSVQLTASLLQPFVGIYTDHRPTPYSLPVGMGFTLSGLLLLAFALRHDPAGSGAGRSGIVRVPPGIVAGGADGVRGAALAGAIALSGGGQYGSALGPLLAALVVLPGGQRSIAWFSAAALLAIIVLARIGAWYKGHGAVRAKAAAALHARHPQLSRRKTGVALAVLMGLVFSKYFYLASLTSYYTFFLMSRFHVQCDPRRSTCSCFWARWLRGLSLAGRWATGSAGST